MAYSSLNERPLVVAGAFARPLSALSRWFAAAQATRARRQALAALLDLDAARLQDLGISRKDVLEAALNGRAPGRQLAAARARNSRQ
ncbi:MAG: hypothetical protein JWR39_1801 [Devosia sp.]|nr:hypothetical protein [Devosia sp.]